uniref:Uncharacterized protein n=1 Tax=Arundo donax TaxID=35708 RepID=A0A0A9CLB3_ARUDO
MYIIMATLVYNENFCATIQVAVFTGV